MAEAPDFGEMISKLTENPEMLGQIMNMASAIMGNMNSNGDKSSESTSQNSTVEQNTAVSPDEEKAAAAFADKTPNIDTAMLSSLIGNLVKSGSKGPNEGIKGGDSKTALLVALKPYMSSKRSEKIDMMIKALKLAELAGGFLGKGGLFG